MNIVGYMVFGSIVGFDFTAYAPPRNILFAKHRLRGMPLSPSLPFFEGRNNDVICLGPHVQFSNDLSRSSFMRAFFFEGRNLDVICLGPHIQFSNDLSRSSFMRAFMDIHL